MERDIPRPDEGVVEAADGLMPHLRLRTHRVFDPRVTGEQPDPAGAVVRGGGNLAVLSEGPAYSEGLPVTPAWEKIAALMDRYFGPVLRGSRPATSLTGLSQAVDEVLRNP